MRNVCEGPNLGLGFVTHKLLTSKVIHRYKDVHISFFYSFHILFYDNHLSAGLY